ncbi:MAG: hypothetical protein P8010_25945, partial [Desulfosarcinaceae bacterium]
YDDMATLFRSRCVRATMMLCLIKIKFDISSRREDRQEGCKFGFSLFVALFDLTNSQTTCPRWRGAHRGQASLDHVTIC